jgi:hypothetical protein
MRVLHVNKKKQVSNAILVVFGVLGVGVIITGIVLGNPIVVGIGVGCIALGCAIGLGVKKKHEYLA